MDDLKSLLESIPTNNCLDREEAKRDLSSALSMSSAIVIEDFMKSWIDISPEENYYLSIEDRQYRQFIIDFKEKYLG